MVGCIFWWSCKFNECHKVINYLLIDFFFFFWTHNIIMYRTNELSKALISATEKASAAATSFNENYKISESVSNVAKSMATIVEQKGSIFIYIIFI